MSLCWLPRLTDAVEVNSVLVVEEVVLFWVHLHILPAALLPPAGHEVHLGHVPVNFVVVLFDDRVARGLGFGVLIVERLHRVSPAFNIFEAWALLSRIRGGSMVSILGLPRTRRVVSELVHFDETLPGMSQSIAPWRHQTLVCIVFNHCATVWVELLTQKTGNLFYLLKVSDDRQLILGGFASFIYSP